MALKVIRQFLRLEAMEENGQNNETGLYGRAYTGQYMERERLSVTEYREVSNCEFCCISNVGQRGGTFAKLHHLSFNLILLRLLLVNWSHCPALANVR
jgi:hypothetical protein